MEKEMYTLKCVRKKTFRNKNGTFGPFFVNFYFQQLFNRVELKMDDIIKTAFAQSKSILKIPNVAAKLSDTYKIPREECLSLLSHIAVAVKAFGEARDSKEVRIGRRDENSDSIRANNIKKLSHISKFCQIGYVLTQGKVGEVNRFHYFESEKTDNNTGDLSNIKILKELFDWLEYCSKVWDGQLVIINGKDSDNSKSQWKNASVNQMKVLDWTMQGMKWIFLFLKTLCTDDWARMALVDYHNGQISFYIRKLYNYIEQWIVHNKERKFICKMQRITYNSSSLITTKCDNNGNDVNEMADGQTNENDIRICLLLIRILADTHPFPSKQLFDGPNGLIVFLGKLLIQCRSFIPSVVKFNIGRTLVSPLSLSPLSNFYSSYKQMCLSLDEHALQEEELQQQELRYKWELIHLHIISVLKCISKYDRLLIEKLFMGFNRTPDQLLWFCSCCNNFQFGIDFFTQFCSKCDSQLHNTIFQVCKYFSPMRKYRCTPFVFYENDHSFFGSDHKVLQSIVIPSDVIHLIGGFLDYTVHVGDRLDVRDEIGNWMLATVKKIDSTFTYRILIGYEGWSSRWDEWIDCRSQRIDHPFTHTLAKN
ncbi:hypothetical protein RFI_09276 [Reticulomyxa filosa]|uniref:Uncharacterized protein n=1 Tax=Reticulomyxa filosa TaxID=46433 RepID=X6NR92_RETFI|nr:hypothetical protein RFI_09276 [Reticulomyxa filosa]|eukprot:ETO27857.1 hypothetical protein RFI_09276 [Reticulomyxa filosa]